MEEPGPPANDLFMKMKELFPEIPLPVIQFNVVYYGHDPAMCQHMLDLHRQYSASTSSASVSPSVNPLLHGFNINTTAFPESATVQGPNHRPTSVSPHVVNHARELTYSPQYQQVPDVTHGISPEVKGVRNFSYAGMSTTPHVLLPNPVLSAPINSVDFHQGFNNAFRVSPNNLHSLSNPTSAGRSISPSAAFVSTSGDSVHVSSPSSAQTFTNVPSHAIDRSRIVWEKAPYDSQLYINVDPFYNFAHYPNSDQRPHSPYANMQFPNAVSQRPVQLSTGFIQGGTEHTNPPFNRNDIFGHEDQRPQLIISPTYWNKIYNSTMQNVLPNEPLCVEQIPVPSPSNTAFVHHYIQETMRQQTEKLNALRYEVLRNKQVHDLCEGEIEKLEKQLKYKTYLPDKKMIQDMKDEISRLRVNCHYLCMEVDLQLKGKAPLGMVDEDFYRTIFTGQQGPLLPAAEQASPTIPPRPAVNQRQVSTEKEEEEENKESSTWECSRCTFANHPAISVCEMCHIPRNTVPGLSKPESLLKHNLSDGAVL